MSDIKKNWFLFLPFVLFVISLIPSFFRVYSKLAPSATQFLIVIFSICTLISILLVIKKYVFKKEKQWKFQILLVLQILIYVYFSSFIVLQLLFVWLPILNKNLCDVKGDKYGFLNTSRYGGKCLKLANDKGKKCEASSDCEGYCLVNRLSKDKSGKCTNFVKGHVLNSTSQFKVLD